MNFDLQALKQALQDTSYIPEIARDLDQSAIAQPAGSAAFPAFTVHGFETVSSTNTAVWELLQQGAEAGTVAIALTQQAGRGQRGRIWNSARGGLYLSLGLMPNLPVAQAGGLTLGSAWGIATALRHCGIPVGIKWLNDLVFAGRKLGGILTETRTSGGQIQQAVIGVGINWSNPVPLMGVNLQTIQSSLPQQPIDSLETLAAIGLQGLRLGYCFWQQHGIEPLVAAYETLLVNLGEKVTIDAPSGNAHSGDDNSGDDNSGDSHSGEIIGITPTGQLRVRLHSPDQTEICLNPGAIRLGYVPESGVRSINL